MYSICEGNAIGLIRLCKKTSESSSENADDATQMHTQTGNEEMPFRLMEVNVFNLFLNKQN